VNAAKHYDSLISRARSRALSGYSERHHIVPRCLGGSDRQENLVDLTAREHYIAHQLLMKIHPSSVALARAANMMAHSPTGARIGNRIYGWIKARAGFATAEMNRKNWANEEYREKAAERRKAFWSKPENVERARSNAIANRDACAAGAVKANAKRWAGHVKKVPAQLPKKPKGPQSEAARLAVAEAKRAWWAQRKASVGYAETCEAISKGTKLAMQDTNVRNKISIAASRRAN
jgi:hypothetical protein